MARKRQHSSARSPLCHLTLSATRHGDVLTEHNTLGVYYAPASLCDQHSTFKAEYSINDLLPSFMETNMLHQLLTVMWCLKHATNQKKEHAHKGKLTIEPPFVSSFVIRFHFFTYPWPPLGRQGGPHSDSWLGRSRKDHDIVQAPGWRGRHHHPK